MNRFVNMPCEINPDLTQKAVMSHQWSRVRYTDNLYGHRFGFRIGGIEYWVNDEPYSIIGESVEAYYEEGGDGRYKYLVYFEFLNTKYEDDDRTDACRQETEFGNFEVEKIKLNAVLTGRNLPDDVQFQLYLSKERGVELVYDRFSDDIWIKQK